MLQSNFDGLKNSKILFVSFKKSEKKIMDVANYVSHKRVKNQLQIRCILGYIKMRNLKIYIFRSTLLSFSCRPNYNVFEVDFLHVCDTYHWLHP